MDTENLPSNNTEEPAMADGDLEPLSKKQKVVSFSPEAPTTIAVPPSADDEPTLEVDAKEAVKLIFVDVNDSNNDGESWTYHNFAPEYTHQLFENEKIVLPLREPAAPAAPATALVSVYIRCADLAHHVVVEDSVLLPAGSDAAAAVLDHLQVGLPARDDPDGLTVVHRDADAAPSAMSRFLDATAFAGRQRDGRTLGRLLSSWGAESARYELYLANHRDVPGCWDTLRRAEKVAMWHIETADAVEFSDKHWEVLNLYRCRPRPSGSGSGSAGTGEDGAAVDTYHSLAGYLTLYTFLNPFKGAKVRVCQALVLPHEQKKGLGREMLLAVYRLAADRSDVAEVTVEDPCPGFQAMRDTVDCEWLAAALPVGLTGHKDVEQWVTSASPQARADHAARLKITPSQAHFAFEAMKDALLRRRLAVAEAYVEATAAGAVAGADASAAAAEANDAVESCEADLKAFRLVVKRRLLGENPDLKAAGKEAMQRELDALYAEMAERYGKCAKHCLRAVEARMHSVAGPQ